MFCSSINSVSNQPENKSRKTPPRRLEYLSRWRKAHPGYKRAWISKRKAAGLTTEYRPRYTARKTDAPVACRLCGKVAVLVQDHDHMTEGLRERICGACNSGLGFFRDRPEVLRAAAVYLEDWQELHRAVKRARVGS